jgi:hypothetical protein
MARIVSPAVAAWLPALGLAAISVVLLRARPMAPPSEQSSHSTL